MRATITGSGIGIPKNVVPNEALTHLMDTTDEWIRTRSGVEQRHYVDDGQGSSDLGAIAAQAALDAAGKTKEDIDAIIFATMTPDHFFPGNGPVLQAKMGFRESIPTFDIRQQCSGFLYGLDLADSLLRSGKYHRVLLIEPTSTRRSCRGTTAGGRRSARRPARSRPRSLPRTPRSATGRCSSATAPGPWSWEPSSNGSGLLSTKLYTNGANIQALYVPGVGFRRRPFVDHQQIDANEFIPIMEGREVFKQAVSKMPEAVRAVCAEAGITPQDIDLLLVHQANLRIIEAVAKQLALPAERVPHNIERYGNTTAGTLPILFHECLADGRIQPGMLICFTALGAGLHWGAALYRV